MSLDVTVYRIDQETGKREFVFDRPIGPERWRHHFYSLPAVKSLGLRLICSLTDRDLYVRGEELETLEQEIKVMQKNLKKIAHAAGGDRGDYALRLEYILEAISCAKAIHGQVNLW